MSAAVDSDVALARKYSPLGKVPAQYYLARSSNIKDKAGRGVRGLFTRKHIRNGQLVGEYRGPRVSEERSQQKKTFTQYFFAVQDSHRVKFVIDGGNSRHSSFLRYVNAPNSRGAANARFVQSGDAILMYTTKEVRPHTELLAWYGPSTKRILSQH